MRKIVIKKNDKKINFDSEGIFVGGYIISSTMCKPAKNKLEYNIRGKHEIGNLSDKKSEE